MSTWGMQIVGLNATLTAMKNLTPKSTEAVERALTTVGLDLQGKAQRRAPKATGHLRGAAYMNKDFGSKHPTVTVGFATVYARRQHEEITWRHTDGECKYLERPLNENRKAYHKLVQLMAVGSMTGADIR